jgi:hypothetical protein
MEVVGTHHMTEFDEESFQISPISDVSDSGSSQVSKEVPIGILLRKDAMRELQSIDLEVLKRIATAVNGKAECKISPSSTCIGASNIVVFIDFDDACSTRWVARFPLLGFNSLTDDGKLLTELIESMVTTMQYLSENSCIPLPRIHNWSSTSENDLKRPYVIMDATSGSNLYQLAHKGFDMEETVEQLSSFVDQWAMYAAELASLQFGQIGSLRRDAAGQIIVDRLCSQTNIHFTPHVEDDIFRGPFNSVVEYLMTSCELKYKALQSELSDVSHSYRDYLRFKLLETLMPYYVYSPLLRGPFVLSHVDFGIQNILVDENNGFKITGIVDWDLAAVLPLQSHLRVPDILMCDTWEESTQQEKNVAAWQIKFAKKYRKHYESSLLKYLQEKQLDYPAIPLLQNGHLFSRFEAALFDTPDVATFELLWTHVYGTESNWRRTVDRMLMSDWGVVMAERLLLPMDGDNGIEKGDLKGDKDAAVVENPPATKIQLSKSHKSKPKWTSRLRTKFRRGWDHVEACFLCRTDPIPLPTRMRSNSRLGELWWTSKN